MLKPLIDWLIDSADICDMRLVPIECKMKIEQRSNRANENKNKTKTKHNAY